MGKDSPDPPYLSQRFETSEWEEGVGTQVAAPLQIDLRSSVWICKDSLKQKLNDPVRSARISKDSLQEQQLICKGSYKPRLVIRKDQQNQTIRKYASKEPRQRRGGAKPLRPPRIMSHAVWGYPPTPQNTTSDWHWLDFKLIWNFSSSAQLGADSWDIKKNTKRKVPYLQATLYHFEQSLKKRVGHTLHQPRGVAITVGMRTVMLPGQISGIHGQLYRLLLGLISMA